MAFTHKYTKIYPRNPKGKTIFLRASLALFVSFIALYKMFTIQYKVSTNLWNPNSNTGIRKPWPKNPIPWIAKLLIIISAKITKKKKFGGRALEPLDPRCGYGFGANALKTDRGVPSRLPPCDPPWGRGQTPCKEYNINPTRNTLGYY